MLPRTSALACFLLSLLGPSTVSAQGLATDALAVVADPVTLERGIDGSVGLFEVHVVFTSPAPAQGSVASVEFGIQTDPGLQVVGRNSTGLILDVAPLEYAIAFPGCGSSSGPEPFTVLTLVILRSDEAEPGAGIRLRGPDGGTRPISATRCPSRIPFEVRDFGGVFVDPATPTVAGMLVQPEFAVEGRSYQVVWATVGGGDWSFDGAPVAGSGLLELPAAASATHRLEEALGSFAERTVTVIREPHVAQFSAEPSGDPGLWTLQWRVFGSNHCEVRGLGIVSGSGAATVDAAAFPIVDLWADNEWGEAFDVFELVPPTGPPQIDEFSVNPESYHYSQSVWLHFEVEGATELRIEPEHGRVPLGPGDVSTRVVADATHTLVATNAHGTVTQDLHLVAPPPLIVDFTALPILNWWVGREPGSPVELLFETLGADSVWIEPGFPDLSGAGSVDVVTPPDEQLYMLYAENGAGTVSESLLLEATTPIIHCPATIKYQPGLPVTLWWRTKFCDELVLMPGSIPLTPIGEGEIELEIEGNPVYELHGTNAAGTSVRAIGFVPDRPWIRKFRFDPLPGVVGQEFEVEWDVVGADEIEVRGAPGLGSTSPALVDTVRTTWSYSAPYRGFPVLVARNEAGESQQRLDQALDVREVEDLFRYFHAWNPQPEPGEQTYVWWHGQYYPDFRISGPGLPWTDTHWNGTRYVSPQSGLNAWVVEASHFSHVQTDTAWVMVDPVSQFEVDKAQVFPGEMIDYLPGVEVNLSWSAPGADRVRIEPGFGDVAPEGGTLQTTIDQTTEFEMHAWYGDEREVHERAVLIAEPVIDEFAFHPRFVRPDESTTLRWQVRGAERVELYAPPDFELQPVAAVDSLHFDTIEYGYYVLRAYNATGQEAADARLLAPYPEFESFAFDPATILLGDTTTLTWDVPEATEVVIDELGTFGPSGSVEVQPQESRGYGLTAIGPTDVVGRVAPVRVDIDATRPATIMVSGAPDHYTTELEPLDPDAPDGALRYEAWVRIENVLGSVDEVWFAVDVPDWLHVEEVENNWYGSKARDLGTEYRVRVYLCESGTLHSTWVTRMVLRQIAPAPAGDPGEIRIHPGPGPEAPAGTTPIGPKWYWCGARTEFGFSLPGMSPQIAAPLEIAALPVPVRELPLRARWTDGGLELAWTDLPESEFRSLDLLRGSAPGNLHPVFAAGTERGWVDPEAAALYAEGALYYRLIGRTMDGSGWSSTELRIGDAPPQPRVARTRLLAARPNPFNPMTTIAWELARPGTVQVTIHDLAGRRIRAWTLADQAAGPGDLVWNGEDERGRRAASGVYLIRLHADGRIDTGRVTLVK